MTFSDMKVAVFVNKIANCRKCATLWTSTRRVWREGFLEDFGVVGALMEASAFSQMRRSFLNGEKAGHTDFRDFGGWS